jgi:hypothetical protein
MPIRFSGMNFPPHDKEASNERLEAQGSCSGGRYRGPWDCLFLIQLSGFELPGRHLVV